MLANTPQGRSVYIDEDIREPEEILFHPVTRDTLDFTKPVALTLVSTQVTTVLGERAEDGDCRVDGALLLLAWV